MISFLTLIYIALSGLTGPQIVEKAIEFHDPANKWTTLQTQIDFDELRANGEVRKTSIYIDNLNGNFCMKRTVDERSAERHIINNECEYAIDGITNLSEKDLETYRLTDERSYTMRDYYLYLWGMPMKLRDPGTIIHDEVQEVEFNDVQSYKVRVTYDAQTGSDIWYFYFNQTNFELVGYQFFHDESINDGEYIILNKSENLAGMNIPNHRSWFYNQDDKYLGKDSFVDFGGMDHQH